ncbi:MAG: histidine kinase [Chitinophaga sp.]|uniref:sensor histidine kinase n=1 Tax=Chitinophaga sp. TaxID=1869181 RepID=UPI0025B96078|nr:histidine kinase [Chitinophaga sp.]MBV8256140.1 histidine kinase [Chitinophaga sp.]
MQLLSDFTTSARLQWLSWLAIFMLMLFLQLPEDGFSQATVYAGSNTLYYALVIYGNTSVLYPLLYRKKRYVWYALAALVFLTAAGLTRAFVLNWVYNTWYAKTPSPLTGNTIFRYMAGLPLLFMLSFFFRIVLDYFTLKRTTASLLLQNTQAELNLLKSQVQPHFLFNTLNNIYYEAYLEAPRTAILIERLSEIMRYFVDESPKDQVLLSTEISFLENYIALEKIRIRHAIDLDFNHKTTTDCHLPPMLLMTFVENIFKHGVDKTSTDNKISIHLQQAHNRLLFRTSNNQCCEQSANSQRGSGIENLRKRLTLLYGDNFVLETTRSAQTFTSFLSIPV